MDPRLYPVGSGYVPNTFRDYPQAAPMNTQAKTANATLAEADSGKPVFVMADGITITLPATVVGMTFIIVNGMDDGTCLVTIAPNSADKIMGMGVTSADSKKFWNTKATAKKGDFIKLLGDGANGWFVQEVRGTWAKEA